MEPWAARRARNAGASRRSADNAAGVTFPSSTGMNRTRFTDLLPPGGAVVQSDLAAGPAQGAWWEQGLRPDEAACVAQAVPKRQREFTAGRNCARRALEQLGWSPAPSISLRRACWPWGSTRR
jgi:4'-phosphopantetheinyl transferase EntD